MRYCDWAVARGLLAIRSHVDVCDPRLLAVEALLDVKARVKPWLDLQLVAFPQDGLLRSKDALPSLVRALDMGVEVVGGDTPLRAHHGRWGGIRPHPDRGGG